MLCSIEHGESYSYSRIGLGWGTPRVRVDRNIAKRASLGSFPAVAASSGPSVFDVLKSAWHISSVVAMWGIPAPNASPDRS